MKMKWLPILKISVGSGLAILVANLLGLQFAPSAGIITLLSIQQTKKETILVAGKRMLSFLFAVLLAAIVFFLTGYHAFSFGIFLLLFITVCFRFGLQDGVAMSSVLVSHFLAEQSMEVSLLCNEFTLMLLGIVIGILFNLYMPDMTKIIKENQQQIEEEMKQILRAMSQYLLNIDSLNLDEIDIVTLRKHLDESKKKAYENMNNTFRSDSSYYISYMEMRSHQCDILDDMTHNMQVLTDLPIQSYRLSELLSHTSDTFHETNNVKELLDKVNELKTEYRKQSLPVTREEFENRAVLLQLLHGFEEFLLLKRQFIENLSAKQIKNYWGTI